MPCYKMTSRPASVEDYRLWQDTLGYLGSYADYLDAKSQSDNGTWFLCGDFGEHCADCIGVSEFLCDYPVGDFNSEEFWQWCRGMVAQGHTVFMSEYEAPPDFKSVWSQEVTSSLRANTQVRGAKKSLEKLFKHESQT